jgi:hypothetical protein
MYDAMPRAIERARNDMNKNVDNDAPYWVKCTANPVACAHKEQLETWQLDIGRGLRAMVDSSESLGERIMAGESGDGIGAMTGWAKEWLPKMYGAHAVGEGAAELAQLAELMQWLDEIIPIDEMIKQEVERFLQGQFPQMFELYDAAKNPSTYMDNIFPANTKAQVTHEMGVAPGGHTLNWRAFAPLYNTVVLSKLALLDASGLNELARRAGIAPIVPATDDVNIMLGVFKSMTQSYQWTGEVREATTTFGICGPETGDPLPKTAQCGHAYRRAGTPNTLAGLTTKLPGRGAAATPNTQIPPSVLAGSGFVLYGNEQAREKIFGVIFKGFGPGPGTTDATQVIAELPAMLPGSRESRQALRVVTDRTEYLRELVAVMRDKVAGATPAAGARLAGVPSRGAAAPQASINWGERCCAKDIAELRAALAQLQMSGARLQNPAILARLGRRPTATQLGARAAQIDRALGAFTNARDAASAARALDLIGRAIDAMAAVAVGTQ